MERFPIRISGICLAAAFIFLLCGAARYNLTAVSAAIEQPETIVIDAGHGGEDGGATGAGGTRESLINLSISLRLEQLLQFCGFSTHMIRTGDHAVYSGDCLTLSEKKISDLKNRVETVNSIHPAILISIHQNHFSQDQYSGAQVFYGKTPGSRRLAEITQDYLRVILDPDNHRACKEGRAIYLLEKTACPGVLVECGFLSNREEELLLSQPEYQKKLVCAITGALITYTRGDGEFEV